MVAVTTRAIGFKVRTHGVEQTCAEPPVWCRVWTILPSSALSSHNMPLASTRRGRGGEEATSELSSHIHLFFPPIRIRGTVSTHPCCTYGTSIGPIPSTVTNHRSLFACACVRACVRVCFWMPVIEHQGFALDFSGLGDVTWQDDKGRERRMCFTLSWSIPPTDDDQVSLYVCWIRNTTICSASSYPNPL
ncbi:hypothetical protein IE53DRAFT_141767 [Violaceomyces palustris]|uniref:Uncharacterized protein n=1 Tax=Violaceomyces palustris TaxID=1673888 RepID=A0ACD0NUK3_9BASI|nr:hypothetical protein IE53DRAFT_141767 [Violaceomyces palustris]